MTIPSTMSDRPLTITSLFRHGGSVHGDSQVVTLGAGSVRRAGFAQVADGAGRLAAALHRLGIRRGDVVGTLAWNNQEHLEAYLAVPSMGAVLHTLNLRLSPEQLSFVINHGGDRVILVDQAVAPLLAAVLPGCPSVEHVVVVGEGDYDNLGAATRYGELTAAEEPGFSWPDIDERAAASMCHTSGTTGDPKGVVYSHRSVFLHSLAAWGQLEVRNDDRLLAIVPMFHVNAWGLPYTGWMVGIDFVMPDRFLQPGPLVQAIERERVTYSVGVPSVWNAILRHLEDHPADLSSLRRVVVGGAAVPRALMEAFRERHGIEVVQAWGMTETSPLGAVALPPKGLGSEQEWEYRSMTGRIVPGVELRIVDQKGEVLPWDGQSPGEIEVRGPWITGSYHGDPAPDRFHDGWLRTGDAGTVDHRGYVRITDRVKDVIKSGGEWISSVDLENQIMAHPDVAEAAVIGVPDPRWDERPLACVVLRQGASVTAEQLSVFLSERVPRLWLPERWSAIDEIPKTSVGKFDKQALRARYAAGSLVVEQLARTMR
jgi:fatty-acyl-CoA synthase